MLSQLPDTELASAASERLAQIGLSADELARRHAIEWHTGEDDLDSFRQALVSVGSDAQPFRLLAYTHDPDRAVLVLGQVTPTLKGELETLFKALDVSADEVLGSLVSEGSLLPQRRAPAKRRLTMPSSWRRAAQQGLLRSARARLLQALRDPLSARQATRARPLEEAESHLVELRQARAELAESLRRTRAYQVERAGAAREELRSSIEDLPESGSRVGMRSASAVREAFDHLAIAHERLWLLYAVVLRLTLILLILAVVGLAIAGVWSGAAATAGVGLAGVLAIRLLSESRR
jgi:hypothetical protein